MRRSPTTTRPGAGPRRTASATGRALGCGLLLALGAGCGMFEPRMDVPRPPEPPDEPVQPVERLPSPEPDSAFARAIEHLQQGRLDEAEALLVDLRAQRPESVVVETLLEQLREPVAELLPPPYREITVRPGQTLSEIAAAEVGDALMFVALARLNDIDVPARLAVGDALRVPAPTPDEDPPPVAAADEPAEPSRTRQLSTDDIETLAEYLLLSGQPGQARQMLIDAVRDRDAPMSSRRMLARLTLTEVAALRQAGADDAARDALDETLAVLDERASFPELYEARARLRVDGLLARARAAEEQGDVVGAYELAQRAARIDAADPEAGELADALRGALIDRYHNDALVAWRDRDVDRAIRLWQTLLDAVPEFEPAQVYLDRATRLRARLDQS